MATVEEKDAPSVRTKGKLDYKRLRTSMDWSWDRLKPFREFRCSQIEQYTGKHYGDEKKKHNIPVNFLRLAIRIMVTFLTPQSLRASITTHYADLKPIAYKWSKITDRKVSDVELRTTIAAWVRDAFFGMGIIKHGIYKKGSITVDDCEHDVGEPYADIISLDDWVHDMSVTDRRRVEYMGSRSRLPYDYVMDSKYFDNFEAKKKLKASKVESYKNTGGMARKITQGTDADKGEFRKFVDLWELWLPREKKLIVLPCQEDLPPLREKSYNGPKIGPYELLSFEDVPDNTMPLTYSSDLYDLHTFLNEIFIKLINQASRQKTYTVFKKGSSKSAKQELTVGDGGMIGVTDPAACIEKRTGGADQANLAMFLQGRNLFNIFSNNIEVLGGLSQMAGTLGQEQMLQGNAGVNVKSMLSACYRGTKNVMEAIAYYIFTDPMLNEDIPLKIEGTDIEILSTLSADDELGDFEQYYFDIDPYSAESPTPAAKLNMLERIFNTYIAPLAPALGPQAVKTILGKLFDLISHYSDIPELGDLMSAVGIMAEETFAGERRGLKSPVSKRTYERVNRSVKTQSGQDSALMQTLLGGTVQPKEAATMFGGGQ